MSEPRSLKYEVSFSLSLYVSSLESVCVCVCAHMTECGQLVGVSSHLLPHGFRESVILAVNKTDQVRIEELAGWGTGKKQPR